MPRVKTVSKKQAILEAASRDFARKDFHEVLIDDIAASARIGKGTIYRYFQTKEELYFAAILKGFDELYAALVATLPEEASPTRRLERIAREILQFFWRRRYLLTLLSNDERFAARESELARRRERVNTLVQQAILDGIQRKEFRGVDARVAAELFRGMIRAANCFRREEDTLEDMVAQIVGIFTDGVARRTA